MIVGVVFAALAGFGRERQQKKINSASGSFAGGLVMMVISGLLVGCMNFAFVYSQDSILGNLSLIGPAIPISVAVTADNARTDQRHVFRRCRRAVTLPRLGRLALEGGSAWHAARQIERHYAATQAAESVRAHVETGSISRRIRRLHGPAARRHRRGLRLCRLPLVQKSILGAVSARRLGSAAG